MKKVMMAGALAVATYAGAAQAADTVNMGGTITSPSNLAVQDLGTGNGAGYQAGATAMLQAQGVVFTGNSGVYSGSMAATTPSNGYTSPYGQGSNQNYLAIQPGGSITYNFATSQTSLGLLFGTIDSYNTITFTGTGGTQSYTGDYVLAQIGGGTMGSTTRNVFFSNLNPFTSVSFSDSQFSAFELVPAAVPEPAAWGMMIVGFGLVGGVLRRRQASVKVRFA